MCFSGAEQQQGAKDEHFWASLEWCRNPHSSAICVSTRLVLLWKLQSSYSLANLRLVLHWCMCVCLLQAVFVVHTGWRRCNCSSESTEPELKSPVWKYNASCIDIEKPKHRALWGRQDQDPDVLLFFVFCFFQKWLHATVNMATSLPAGSECWQSELTSACNRWCRHILCGLCTRAGSSLDMGRDYLCPFTPIPAGAPRWRGCRLCAH